MPTLYSSDLAASDYYLLMAMANDFDGEKFALRKLYEKRRSQFFANKVLTLSNKAMHI